MIKHALTLRAVCADDETALAKFFTENDRPSITNRFHPFPLDQQTARRIASAQHLDRYYIALIEKEVVGMVMLRGWDEGYSIPSFGIVVGHNHHGQGYGRQMTEFALSEARRVGCTSVRLTVDADNERAVHLYQSLGFSEAKRDANGKIVMSKVLS